MTDVIVRVLAGGRVTLPENMRKSADVKIGDFMIVKESYGEFTLTVAKVEPRKTVPDKKQRYGRRQ